MKQTLFLISIIISLSNCMAQFSTKEINLINSATTESPFRVLKITEKEDSLFLRQKAKDVSFKKDDNDLKLFLERLKQTMILESGVGIAAPQVGIGRNIFIFTRINHPNRPFVVAINPRIINHPNETVCFERDGCLSIPEMSGNSVRYPWIDVEYMNEKGEIINERLEGYSRTDDFTGIIFQHEYDHLQGILYIDKLCKE